MINQKENPLFSQFVHYLYIEAGRTANTTHNLYNHVMSFIETDEGQEAFSKFSQLPSQLSWNDETPKNNFKRLI